VVALPFTFYITEQQPFKPPRASFAGVQFATDVTAAVFSVICI